jgi:hypothetical protein
MRAGRLPDRPPHRIWAGRGTGALCRICNRLLESNEIEVEFEAPPGEEDGSAGVAVDAPRVHDRCLAAWVRVLDRLRVVGEE